MASKIFRTILERKIDVFVSTFDYDSNSLFKNNQGKLIHPGEYGMYREETFKELLKLVLDKEMSISDGFIITSKNDISTQCDVVIYNSNAIPLIDNGIEKFYPIEEVIGIGEIKSDLKYTEFKKALIKLAKNKMLSSKRIGKLVKKNGILGECDYLTSFLVCKKLKFDIKESNLEDIYGSIPRQYWHNAILSLEDGCIGYKIIFNNLSPYILERFREAGVNIKAEGVAWEYPVNILNQVTYECQADIAFAKTEDKYKHIMDFLIIINRAVEEANKYSLDVVRYLGFNLE